MPVLQPDGDFRISDLSRVMLDGPFRGPLAMLAHCRFSMASRSACPTAPMTAQHEPAGRRVRIERLAAGH